jgi:hypothetical protein
MFCYASGCLKTQVPGEDYCDIHAPTKEARGESEALSILDAAREDFARLDNWRKAGEAGVIVGLVSLTAVIFAAVLPALCGYPSRRWPLGLCATRTHPQR